MVVLSLFDGMSCGRVALERAGIKVNKSWSGTTSIFILLISPKL